MDRQTASVDVDEFPGPRARERVEHHSRFAAPSTYVYGFVWDTVADASGPFVTDVDGNVLLDFTSHVGAARWGTTTRSCSTGSASSTSSGSTHPVSGSSIRRSSEPFPEKNPQEQVPAVQVRSRQNATSWTGGSRGTAGGRRPSSG